MTLKQKKDINFLILVTLFLWLFFIIFNALLGEKTLNFSTLNCQNKTCQIQTFSYLGLGPITQEQTISRSLELNIKHFGGRTTHYYFTTDNADIPFEFLFEKSALHFQNQIKSAKDFTYSSFSVALRFFFYVYCLGIAIALAIILLQKEKISTAE